MNSFFGYIRVSTQRQGIHGVSLTEQRSAIEVFAARHGLTITRWFEERQSAAKRGRPIYGEMVKLLRQRKADGVIVHKIDRSARHLRDWADLGDLIDSGVSVRFANEDLDMRSRGGRLAADIQAVVAADYIRNLREESKKGVYGRLKQGLWPFKAPPGYLDRGGGKLKEIDPKIGPLARLAFELYASGRFTLITLGEEMQRRGLCGVGGGPLSKNGLSRILRNPFYIGLLYVRRANQTFQGAHTPLITVDLFERVQAVLDGKAPTRAQVHPWRFRRLFRCHSCGCALTGETQKGHTYYRCHRCKTCVREESIDAEIRRQFSGMRFSPADLQLLYAELSAHRSRRAETRGNAEKNLRLQLGQTKERLRRLVSMAVAGTLHDSLFEEEQRALLKKQRQMEEILEEGGSIATRKVDEVWKRFERAETALLSYRVGLDEEKRQVVEEVTSNREAEGKNVVVKLQSPYAAMSATRAVLVGGDPHDRLRILKELVAELLKDDVDPCDLSLLDPNSS